MPSVRIWTLESDYDARAVGSLAEKLALHLQLDRLSIQISGKSALPNPRGRAVSPHEILRKAVQNYLRQDDCVILVIDSDGPMSSHRRRQEPNSLFNQIMQIVNDQSFSRSGGGRQRSQRILDRFFRTDSARSESKYAAEKYQERTVQRSNGPRHCRTYSD